MYTNSNNTTVQYRVEDFRVFAQTNLHKHPGQDVGVEYIITHDGYNVSRHPWRDLFFVYVKHDIGKGFLLFSKEWYFGANDNNSMANLELQFMPNHCDGVWIN